MNRISLRFSAVVAALLAGFAPARAACDWPAAKKDILEVLEGDAARGEEFRQAAKAGRDSLDAIEKIVDAAARERIKACGYEAAELLTQKGFPPLH